MNSSLLSWNIWAGKFLGEVIHVLTEKKPDVIALQEVISVTDRSNNQAEQIAKALGYNYVWEKTAPFRWRGTTVDWGEAILSKYDIEKSGIVELSADPRRIALWANIVVSDKPFRLYSTHLIGADDERTRMLQFDEAQRLVSVSTKQRTIITGDFNAAPDSHPIAYMCEDFVDAGARGEPTWCLYPDGGNMPQFDKVEHRYDYVFHTRDIKVSRLNTIRTTGSDHLPVLAEISV